MNQSRLAQLLPRTAGIIAPRRCRPTPARRTQQGRVDHWQCRSEMRSFEHVPRTPHRRELQAWSRHPGAEPGPSSTSRDPTKLPMTSHRLAPTRSSPTSVGGPISPSTTPNESSSSPKRSFATASATRRPARKLRHGVWHMGLPSLNWTGVETMSRRTFHHRAPWLDPARGVRSTRPAPPPGSSGLREENRRDRCPGRLLDCGCSRLASGSMP